MPCLKEYQRLALNALKDYFELCKRLEDADTAFYETTKIWMNEGISYHPIKELPGLPYVCIRIPTGGGKTFIAAHSIGIAMQSLLQLDRSLIIWLVPSNAILEQTIKALKDNKHFYRQAIEASIGHVEVLDIKEALNIQKSLLDFTSVIIVSTMQAFRVEETEGRKVYDESGSLMSHFDGLPESLMGILDQYDNGTPIKSLSNVLRLRRPIVIVDEAHNVRTPLSFETLARLSPSCIMEFTATPDLEQNPSNVLYTVSAAELKSENMVKLPIFLETRSDWKELLSDAITQRKRLEDETRKEVNETGEYLRPIMLLQAQARSHHQETLTVDVIERTLIEDFNIPPNQIARATSEDHDLEKVDLFKEECTIKYIITVQALREGWDCSFAYILCSVADVRSSRAVEQILGRIMRLPNAKRKKSELLNRAYAFTTSDSFNEAASSLTDALVENGFDKQEAKDFIIQTGYTTEPLFPSDEPSLFSPVLVLDIPKEEIGIEIPMEFNRDLIIDETKKKLSITKAINEKEKEQLKLVYQSHSGHKFVDKIYWESNSLFPRTKDIRIQPVFSIPVISIKVGELWEPFEETHFMDHLWQLSQRDPILTDEEYSRKQRIGETGKIDISQKGKVEYKFISNLSNQMVYLSSDMNFTQADLIHWLDRKIPHPDIPPEESSIFIMNVIKNLIELKGFSLEELIYDKFRLLNAVKEKIDKYRKIARNDAFQSILFNDVDHIISVTPEVSHTFDPDNYPYNTYYRGRYNFVKHFYEKIGDLKDDGEESECAVFLDTLPEVKVWIKNIDRHETSSFWLQTSTDKFYPDFVSLLNDGRYLVVEFKGEDRYSNDDSREKRLIGELWEKRSNGKCLFIMTKGKDFESIRAKIMKS